ncbi:MAG: hypothetical protein WD469_00105, partial [Paenibacillaceae bacterium]
WVGQSLVPSASANAERLFEVGGGKAGYAKGDFYATPLPSVKAHKPGFRWHFGKVLFEKMWFRIWF